MQASPQGKIDLSPSVEESVSADSNVDSFGSSREEGSSSGGRSSPDEYKQIHNYAKTETRRVQLSRFLVVSSILAVGALVSALTYVLLNNEIVKDSDDAFVLFANTIEDSFRFQIKSIFQANRALSRAITTSASTAGADFPHFSIPAFELLAYEARTLAGFETVIFGPVAHRVDEWLSFSQATRGWMDESRQIYDVLQPGSNRSSEPSVEPLPNHVWTYGADSEGLPGLVALKRNGIFVPSLHTSPPPLIENRSTVYQNVNLFSVPYYRAVSLAAVELKDSLFSPFREVFSLTTDNIVGVEAHESLHAFKGDHGLHPHSVAAQPVYKTLNGSDVVGYVYNVVAWDNYLANLLPQGVNGIYVVLRNSCGQAFTYELVGRQAILIGEGDRHDREIEDLFRTIDFAENYFDPELSSVVSGHCQVFLDVYQSVEFKESYESRLPVIFSSVVALLFFMMASFFFIYARFVETRNNKVVGAAARSTAIVSSLFPSNVRDQLLAEKEEEHIKNKNGTLKGYLTDQRTKESGATNEVFQSQPIADLFLETTVMFADISGFTAWSSVREPVQVFRLLEAVYQAFDTIARRRKVFKVETVGDCYVAVCGLPTPCKNHYIVMARFAKDCIRAMNDVVDKLEVYLGPGTSDLTIRVGLHSGQVTAGVIRGERSRFQLFGDTMNTASRMESNGRKGCIQVSEDTAKLLTNAGKGAWLTLREDKIDVKGKGEMQTFWLDPGSSGPESVSNTGSSNGNLDGTDFDDNTHLSKANQLVHGKAAKLVDWNVEVLQMLLKQIIVNRASTTHKVSRRKESLGWGEPQMVRNDGSTVLDEVKEIISLPRFKENSNRRNSKVEDVELPEDVYLQLHDFVTSISSMYRNNPFHNFEHASHVAMSVVKLLKRIVAPSTDEISISLSDHTLNSNTASVLHDHTYGITSDPLTQFACVFSALIHDLDHPGVPNAQLVKENTPLAKMYHNKSVAEQNSVDIAWGLLMDSKYTDLRGAIYINDSELSRFRQLVVNSVMATDIVDKELKTLRNARWDKAFSETFRDSRAQDAIDRRATIVIEHLIQASDVAHTMQHWHVYRKWNERFFTECYEAYLDGRAATDPSVTWYEGEIGFFDFYIIPLTKKLKECGVFGVSSDEYLNYAMKNREEWVARGRAVVSEMVDSCNSLMIKDGSVKL